MRKSRLWWGLSLILVVALAACNREEKKREALIQEQVNLLDRQFTELQKNRADLAQQTQNLAELLRQFDAELAKSRPRVLSASSATSYLRELTTRGFGESPGKWVLTHFWFTPSMLGVMLFCLLALWFFFRLRQHQLESQMNAEINRVIERLATEATKSRESVPEPGPTSPDTETPPQAPPPSEASSPQEKPEEGEEPSPEPEPSADKNHSLLPREFQEKKAEAAPSPEEKSKPTVASSSLVSPTPEPIVAPVKTESLPTKPRNKTPSIKKGPIKKEKKKEIKTKPPRRTEAKKCKVKGCPNKHRSKGFCNKHYQQWRNGVLKEELED